MTPSCPSESELRLFLEESADESLATFIGNHLEECIDCRSTLDALLDSSELSHTTGSLNDVDDTVERLMKRLSAAPPEQPESRQPVSLAGKTLGQYELLERIGHGTTGVVYRAIDLKLEREVAVKVLKNGFAESERARTRLEREARAAASIRHNNVVGIIDVCIDPRGISYLVMELVEGGTLRNRIRKSKSLPPKESAEIVSNILAGLAAAHKNGLVHRDLKCSNILVEKDTGAAKLTDFGLVRELDSNSNLTRDNVIAGTPAYMSPEQIRTPNQVDHLADIYSIGIVLYQLLAGELPFRGVDRMVLQQVIHDEPPSLRRQNDLISRDLETICLKAMEKSPESRYQTADLMRQDIQRWLNNKPIMARRVGVLGKAWNWSKRNRLVASLIALSLSLLTVLAIGSTVAAISMRTSGLEAERHAIAARRQRDQSMETLRELVFEVNELLEPESPSDFDDVQATLLKVALDGIEQIDKTGSEAGLLDVSAVAAKNRLGDVYLRMDRLAESEQQYSAALAIAKQVNANEDLEILTRERLRSFEGLASLAMLVENGNVDQYVSEAESAATLLSKLTGEDYYPTYFIEETYLLGDDEVAEIESQLKQHLALPSELPRDIENAYQSTQSLGWHFLESHDDAKAEQVFESLRLWLDATRKANPKPRFERTWKIGKHIALMGIAHVAQYREKHEKHLEYLRKAIDVLPRNANQNKFHDDSTDLATNSLSELIGELEYSETEEWMPEYFGLYSQLTQQASESFATDRWLAFEYYVAEANYIQKLKDCNSLEVAESAEQELRSKLKKLDRSRIPQNIKNQLGQLLD